MATVEYAVKFGRRFIATLYADSTSEADTFDKAIKCKTIDEAKALVNLSARRNVGSNKEFFNIQKRIVSFEDIELT